jgi:exonuclease III
MNGVSTSREGMSCIEKWAAINCIIYNEQIAILALQETHLDQTLLDQITDCFRKNLEIMNSPLLTNPHASAGVAFIINKALIHPKELTLTEIILGRAIMIRLKWLETCETSIINVYVPHNHEAQPDFWAKAITNRHTLCLLLPDFILGDFNVTKDSIDRAPTRQDKPHTSEVIREVCQKWNMQDTWQHMHPDVRCFTYCANIEGEQIQSCLDCIYMAHDISQYVFD